LNLWKRSQGFEIRKSSNDTRVCNKESKGSGSKFGVQELGVRTATGTYRIMALGDALGMIFVYGISLEAGSIRDDGGTRWIQGCDCLNKGIKFNLSFAKCGGYSKEVNLKAVELGGVFCWQQQRCKVMLKSSVFKQVKTRFWLNKTLGPGFVSKVYLARRKENQDKVPRQVTFPRNPRKWRKERVPVKNRKSQGVDSGSRWSCFEEWRNQVKVCGISQN
ncbi:unnamed protein product, partial [Arabidopsis halleri]